MIMQSKYAAAKIEALARRLDDAAMGIELTEDDWKIETIAAFRELIRYVNILERKLEQCEIDANRRRFF